MTFRNTVFPSAVLQDDAAPLGVQLSSPGPESPKCRGTNSLLVLALMVAPLLVVVTVGLLLSL